MSLKNVLKLVIAVGASQLAGLVGSFFTTPAINNWYASLEKPNFNPPSWLFGPVWITLYFLMGVAAFLVWQKGWERKKVKSALGIYSLQLFLNTLWSIIFFGFQNPSLAFINIIFLWLAIFWTMMVFYKISKPASCLLVPYLLWVSFASFLNFTIWRLN